MMYKDLYIKIEQYYEKYGEEPDLFFINTVEYPLLWRNLHASACIQHHGATLNRVDNSLYIFGCLIVPFRSNALYGYMFAENNDFRFFDQSQDSKKAKELDDEINRFYQQGIAFYEIFKHRSIIHSFSDFNAVPDNAIADRSADVVKIPIVMIFAYQREIRRIKEASNAFRKIQIENK